MQLHNSAAAQTLFAMNNWGVDGNTLALGIGNRPTSHPDWTFASNAGSDTTRAAPCMCWCVPLPLRPCRNLSRKMCPMLKDIGTCTP